MSDDRTEKMRVLVIDDEEPLRRMLLYVLGRLGHEVAVAAGGAEGLALAEKSAFDVVLCDLMMEGMDGRQVLGRLKTLQPALPVVLASGYATEEDRVELLGRGAFEVLHKPVDMAVLLAVLRAAVSSAAGEGRTL